MATWNGIGTARYDWRRRPDGSVEATVWFVVFFFPVLPLRREQVRVVDAGLRPAGLIDTVSAFLGSGSGYHSSVEVLGVVPLSWTGVVRTYVMGFLVVPLITFVGPIGILATAAMYLEKQGHDTQRLAPTLMAIAALVIFLWTALVLAWILDRSAGRHHVSRPQE